MAEALTRRGHDVHVATYPLGDETQHIPYRIHRIATTFARLDPSPGPSMAKLFYLDPLLCARTRKLLAAGAFDVVHAHHYEGLMAALLARRLSVRLPIVYDAHTLLESELPQYRTRLPRRWSAVLGQALDRRIPAKADHVIAVTDRMRQWFLAATSIAPDRISVIANGVTHEHFGGSRCEDASRPAGARIVFAGNLATYQGIDLLLRAFVRLRKEQPTACLELVTSSSAEEVYPQIRKLGVSDAVSVINSDYASLPSFLAAADVLVNPRIDCDGIPQKLLNYMAAGRPIVSFTSSAPLLAHGQEALLVPDGDVPAFAAAMLRILREPELGRSLGRAARNLAIADYSWAKVAERVESVYQGAIGLQPRERR
jgi:glycosyltransferase involved in cell wall biosynthesis